MIDYKINTASRKDLHLHLIKCDDQFIPKLSNRVDLKDYAEKLHKYGIIFEAWEKKVLVGVIASYFDVNKRKEGFISNVSVLEEFEKKGIAGQLVKILKKYAVNLGCFALSLKVNAENKEAIIFYKKHGFKSISREEDIISMTIQLKI